MDKEELLYNQIYERTKEFGRAHFIKEIMNLERENQQLKEQNEQKDKAIDECIEYVKRMGKYDGKYCTRNFKMMSADFNYLLEKLQQAKEVSKDVNTTN